MKVRELELTNFNNCKFKVNYYQLQEDTRLKIRKRPLMVIFPGGHFTHISLREGEPVALAYAMYGFECAIISYNLVTDPQPIYPDAALSGLMAIKYFRDNSEKLGIDPDKIVTIGFSAGGHVASAVNVMAESQKWQNKFGFKHDEVAPNATILGYPLIDINKIGIEVPAAQMAYLPKEAELLDTAKGVTKQTPPTFIFQTVDDAVVLINNAIEYLTALREHNVPFEAHLFDKGMHGYSLGLANLEYKDKPWLVNPHAARWFKMSIEWLQHLKIAA
ncbi:acetyl esterase/lipase [Lactobacillus colini]|uniref:Acetyl esterase/lipase n=1 Tax=Lactobacillus colini TaxID=1819254 RepID=A0ABS4MCP5_9LACO|nr:alpha/beta hydrolase [Lactobacillus colini]MBP2057457.1 acetyl esterase/lipase [Lactobacillus colini]